MGLELSSGIGPSLTDGFIRTSGLPLVIVDDCFPYPLSSFRFAEFCGALDAFPDATVCSSGKVAPALGCARPFPGVIREHIARRPEHGGRIQLFDGRPRLEGKAAYSVFFHNISSILEAVNRDHTPFAFTLYPGGGFRLDAPDVDTQFKRIFNSRYFQTVIVTQPITRDYLLAKSLCDPERIRLVFGLLLPPADLSSLPEKQLYGVHKPTIDICFAAWRYMLKGRDKGYDTFVEVAKLLARRFDHIHFHAVGPWDANDADVSALGGRMRFHPPMSEGLKPFFRRMDLILSPNAPFVLAPGKFDGFPTGCCVEAGLSGVAVCASDALKQNGPFTHGRDILITNLVAADIAEVVGAAISDYDGLTELARRGSETFARVFGWQAQFGPRLEVLSRLQLLETVPALPSPCQPPVLDRHTGLIRIEETSPAVSRSYHLNPETGVHSIAGSPPFPYSDGESREERLLRFIRAARDCSSTSAEMAAGIVDWPSYYHLSHLRSNLLRPVAELLAGDVLEVGAGCGALTRFLGETARSVVAVEGSPRRAEIAAARCKGLPNVGVYCDHFGTFAMSRKFEAIVCIGVMEYSPVFLTGPDPFGHILALAAGHLAEDGYLLIAIENRLGLKYFAGAPEDHTGIRFQGIEELYTEGGPRTLGRLEWRRQLEASGLECAAFLYPFPDYKHPQALLSDAAFDDPDLNAPALIRHLTSPNQDRDYERLFSEEMVWPVLADNGIAREMANSFLIVARKSGSSRPCWQPSALAYQYGSGIQTANFRETRIARDASGHLVARHAIAPSGQKAVDVPLAVGKPYMDGLYRVVNRRGWTHAAVSEWADPWFRYLHSRATIDGSMLPGGLVDCIPPNLVTTAGDAIRMFDTSTAAPNPVSIEFVLFRGLMQSFLRIRTCAAPHLHAMTLRAECAFGAMEALGVTLSPARRDGLLRMEAEFQNATHGTPVDVVADSLRTGFTIRGSGPSSDEHFDSQVYWRCGGDPFTELCSKRVRNTAESGTKRIRIEIPENDPPPVELRLDLSNRPDVFTLMDIGVAASDGRELWTWDHDPAAFTGRNEVVFLRPEGPSGVMVVMPGADPYLVLPIPAAALAALRAGGVVEFRIYRDDPSTVVRRLASELAMVRH